MPARRALAALATFVLLAWACVPLLRAILLVQRGASAATPVLAMAHEAVSFSAADGVRLSGTYLPAAGARATVVLVHGFKNTGADMLEHASFLHDAGYAVLVYDSRGCGVSGGVFGVGATEERDVRGAVSFVKDSARAGSSHIAVLGVSLGAGDALLAAADDARIDAVIADSSWADERVQLARMATLDLPGVSVPLLGYEPALVDAIVGGRLEDARPRDAVARIAPRRVLFIHSADDQNATTPLEDARAMYETAGQPKEIWIAPRGGHAGALAADRDEYTRRVLAFLDESFG